jgi:hypothetical protein
LSLRTAAWIFAFTLTATMITVIATEIWQGQLLVPDRPYRLLVSSWTSSLVAAVLLTRIDQQRRQIIALDRRLAKREEDERLARIEALLEPDRGTGH